MENPFRKGTLGVATEALLIPTPAPPHYPIMPHAYTTTTTI